jgi:hypothetical protein
MDIPKFNFLDFIASQQLDNTYRKIIRCYDKPEILRPDEIPVYPRLVGEEFPYTKEFVEEVLEHTPDMVKNDLTTIEQKLGQKLYLKLTSKGLCSEYNSDICEFKKIEKREGALTGIAMGSSSIWLPTSIDDEIIIYKPENHPLPLPKAKAYATSINDGEIQLVVWKSHNITYQGFCFEIVLRNFAIAFNNLAIDRLKNSTP